MTAFEDKLSVPARVREAIEEKNDLNDIAAVWRLMELSSPEADNGASEESAWQAVKKNLNHLGRNETGRGGFVFHLACC